MAELLPGSVGIKEINKDQVVVPFTWVFNAGKTARVLTLKSGYILGMFSFEGIETPEITIPAGSTELSLPENVEVDGDLNVTGDGDVDGSLNVDTALTVNGATTRGLGIIEEGSNANGEYQRYEGGLLHMTGWGFVTWTSGAQYKDITVTLPYEVADKDDIRLTATIVGNKSTDPISVSDTETLTNTWVTGLVVSSTQISIRVMYYTTVADTKRRLFAFDIWARWS
jgi:hypothetical protein